MEDGFSFPKTEEKILDFWQKEKIFEQSLERTKSCLPYIFYDGPPFATGLPHHGHLVGSILKDVIPRFFTMKGRYVQRRFGWDCHGLPIEHEIDKKFNISAQEVVEKLGIATYNNECRQIVQRYTKEWEKTITRLGRWVDFKNDYKTMDASFMESIWWVFKQLWGKELIYQGTKVVPFSTSLGTVLSNFEASSNYKDVQDPAITVKVFLPKLDCHILLWTTTPWTLPFNLALCINESLKYAKVKDKNNNIFIIGKSAISRYEKNELEIIEEIPTSTLIGQEYEEIFPYYSKLKKEGYFKIFADNYVTEESGTGIVHLAPAFGEDDARVLKENNLDEIICAINEQGNFSDEIEFFAGLYIKDADKKIIEKLKTNKQLYDRSTIVHSYPFCPRSDTPLIYRSIPSWYVNVTKIKSNLINNNKKIHWVPNHIQDGRFGQWLENARDWAVSRNRIWGTPIPIWINDTTGKSYCIGSREELQQLTGTNPNDLHREFIDQLEFTLPNEKGVYRRIPEVFDCWFESGSMPYAQIHYPFENQETFNQGFPAEFIAEGLDQTRGWFYTLMVLSTALFDKPAFKNVIVNGLVLASDGQKMSKRLRNYTQPDTLMDKYGADALRLYLITSGLVKAEEQKFTDDGVKEMIRKALLPWFNALKFFKTYTKIDNWKYEEHFIDNNNILDQWIISRLQSLKSTVNEHMQKYKLFKVIPELFDFIDNLTNNYIRFNRGRFWADGFQEDKQAAYSTLFIILKDLSIIMAPFAPFFADYCYLELQEHSSQLAQSVHLESFSDSNEKQKSSILEKAVNLMNQIIILGRQKRNQEKIKVKTPLQRLTIIHENRSITQQLKLLNGYIKDELNVKEILFDSKEENYINLTALPNSPVVGKKLGKEFKKFNTAIKNLSSKEIRQLEKEKKLLILDRLFIAEEILILREAKEGMNALSNSFISIDLDCSLNTELINEGFAREIINRIQKTRKDSGLNVEDRINIYYHASEKLYSIIKEFNEHICQETLARNITNTTQGEKKLPFSYEIDEYKLELYVEKL